MAETFWVQLYVGEETRGDAFELEPLPKNVGAIKKLVKDMWGEHLHCPAPELKVYAPSTPLPIGDGAVSLDPRDPVSAHCRDGETLIVKAEPLPQNGALPAAAAVQRPATVTTSFSSKSVDNLKDEAELGPLPQEVNHYYDLVGFTKYTNTWQYKSSSKLLPNHLNKLLNSNEGEQLQMHLGGSLLVLYPMLLAAEEWNSDFKKNKKDVDLAVKADVEWQHAAIATNTHENYGDQRLSWKPKNDAWMEVSFGLGRECTAPLFPFEHKVKNMGGRAFRKSVLMAQLTWRRYYMAALAENSEQALKICCEGFNIFFGSLEGRRLQTGYVKGTVADDGSVSFTLCHVFGKELMDRDSTQLAVWHVYKLVLSTNGIFNDQLASLVSLCKNLTGKQLKDMENTTSAKSLTAALSRKKNDRSPGPDGAPNSKKPKRSETDSSSSSDDAEDSNSKDTGTGAAPMLSTTKKLLSNHVQNLKFLYAAPIEVFHDPNADFDGSNIFTGVLTAPQHFGWHVFVKAFRRLEAYDRELRILKAVQSVPRVQKLVLWQRTGDFAVIVTRNAGRRIDYSTHDCDGLRRIGQLALDTLATLHAMGIFHCDLKPDNIAWDNATKEPILIDFGIGKFGSKRTLPPGGSVSSASNGETPSLVSLSSSTKTEAKVVERGNSKPRIVSRTPALVCDKDEFVAPAEAAGTTGYIAPEIVAGEGFSGKADVYSLGRTLETMARHLPTDIVTSNGLKDAIDQMTAEDLMDRCSAKSALTLRFFDNEP